MKESPAALGFYFENSAAFSSFSFVASDFYFETLPLPLSSANRKRTGVASSRTVVAAVAASEMFYKLLIVVFLAVSLHGTPSDGQKKKEVSGFEWLVIKCFLTPHMH